MNPLSSKPDRHDGIIAGLLWYGTLVASVVIMTGIVLGAWRRWAIPLAWPRRAMH